MKPRAHVNQGDAVDFLRGLPSRSVDLVVTDPAYESLEKHRAHGTTTRLDNWFEIFRNERFPEFFAEVFRVLVDDAHFYFLCDAETMFVAKPMAEAAGFTFWKPLVWDKQAIGMGYHYRARYEFVLFFEKGARQLADLGVPDVLSFKRVRNAYPTEKPVALLDVLVRQSTAEGELVVDPFCGSGSTLDAATTAGRNALGNDLSAAAVALARTRVAAHIVPSAADLWPAGAQASLLAGVA